MNFTVTRLPRLVFGEGRVAEVPREVAALGRRCLLVTGARSLEAGPFWPALAEGFARENVTLLRLAVAGEPSPETVDEAVARFRAERIEVVAAIGGGSALDAAKAVAGLLPSGNSVMDHLEGVGRGVPYHGPALPLVAVPTTAGTGSEATKNAVLSRIGPDGFKKSFRHDDLIARVAVVDPALLATCPFDVMAANGMDAFTQLLESYTSTNASPFTDALAWSGLEAFRDGFFAALNGDPEGRARLAYAATLSGICLAQTGLGAVHGLASPLGAWFPIPHGVACGTLVAEATEINIEALRARLPASPALPKYARVGELMAGNSHGLPDLLRRWVERLGIARLDAYGVDEADLPRLAAASGGNSMKTNPLVLEPAEICEILRRRL
jgi:alcohol dehydrogenase